MPQPGALDVAAVPLLRAPAVPGLHRGGARGVVHRLRQHHLRGPGHLGAAHGEDGVRPLRGALAEAGRPRARGHAVRPAGPAGVRPGHSVLGARRRRRRRRRGAAAGGGSSRGGRGSRPGRGSPSSPAGTAATGTRSATRPATTPRRWSSSTWARATPTTPSPCPTQVRVVGVALVPVGRCMSDSGPSVAFQYLVCTLGGYEGPDVTADCDLLIYPVWLLH